MLFYTLKGMFYKHNIQFCVYAEPRQVYFCVYAEPMQVHFCVYAEPYLMIMKGRPRKASKP